MSEEVRSATSISKSLIETLGMHDTFFSFSTFFSINFNNKSFLVDGNVGKSVILFDIGMATSRECNNIVQAMVTESSEVESEIKSLRLTYVFATKPCNFNISSLLGLG